MVVTPVEWNDAYNVGEPVVDRAHRNLFAAMNRLTAELAKDDRTRTVLSVKSAIEYLEKYVVRHFTEEEEFQLRIKYPGYRMHKALHDNLREVTLPSLKKQLEESNYSQSSVKAFVGMFAGWLTGHILIEDRAITGRSVSRHFELSDRETLDALDEELVMFLKEYFRLNTRIHDRHYAGEQMDEAVYYESTYTGSSGSTYTVTLTVENSLVRYMVSTMSGIESKQIDQGSLLAFLELAQSVNKQTLAMVYEDDYFEFKESKICSRENLLVRFEKFHPLYSVLWNTNEGYFGITIDSAK